MKTQKFNGRALSLAVASILAVGVGAFSGNSYAGTNTATLQVSADIQETCEVSTTAVEFGTYDPVGAHAAAPLENSGGRVTMTCTTGATPIVALDLGSNENGTTRQMVGGTGADVLAYELYQPGGFTAVWGSEVGVDTVEGAVGDGEPHDLIINARIFQGQNVPVGNYADTVTVAVTF